MARAVPITAAIIAAEATTATPAGSQRRLAPRKTQATTRPMTPTEAAQPGGDRDDDHLVVGHAASSQR